MNCLYCNNMLPQFYGSAIRRKCFDCNVEYQLEQDVIKWVFMDCKLGKKGNQPGYSFVIDLEYKCSEICGPGYIHDSVVRLPFIPPNITPSNVEEKIKLYLTFL